MRRRTKITIDPKYILLVLSILCIILIVVSFKFEDKMSPIKTTVGDMVTPMQKGINTIGAKLSEKINYLQKMQDLIDENAKLKEQVNQLSYKNRILQQEQYELESLRKQYKLDAEYSSYPKVAAKVISGEATNWFNTFTINKGKDDGLAVDMNVIAGEGLVGIITEVGHHYAKVRSIIDDNSNLSGMFLKSNDNFLINGNLELMDKGIIEVSEISADATVKDGDEVVTSRISSKYLPGILIGYIKDVKMDASNMTMSGYLTPAADFSNLDTVLIITELKDASELKEILE